MQYATFSELLGYFTTNRRNTNSFDLAISFFVKNVTYGICRFTSLHQSWSELALLASDLIKNIFIFFFIINAEH